MRWWCVVLVGVVGCQQLPHDINMSNTVQPIITKLAEDLCGYANFQGGDDDGWAHSGKLIAKRETAEHASGGCIEQPGNVYYIRCYKWKWTGNPSEKKSTRRLWYHPYRDVPIGAYSCIPEWMLRIPYADRALQDATLGVTFER